MTSRPLTLFAALGLLAGCTSLKTPMTRFALDYNRMIADARNGMILLNIARAANREPMHFSALSSVEGTLSRSAEAGSSADFQSGPNAYGASVNFSGGYQPTFTVVPLNTSDFVNGILAPVSPDAIKLFLSQGWRQEMLAPLLIEKIVCPDGTEVSNDADAKDVQAFSELRFEQQPPSAAMVAQERPGSKSEEVVFDPPLSGRFVLPVDADTAASLLNSKLDQNFTVTQRGLRDNRVLLDLVRQEQGQVTIKLGAGLRAECGLTAAEAESLRAVPAAARSTAPAGKDAAKEAIVYFRSTDAIIYYLGELLRRNVDTTISYHANPADPTSPVRQMTLFHAERSAGRQDAVRVEHRGTTYALRLDPEGQDRSTTVLTLINQMIALQTSPEALNRGLTTIRAR